MLVSKYIYQLLGSSECLVKGNIYKLEFMDKYPSTKLLNEGKPPTLMDIIKLTTDLKMQSGSVELLDIDENFTLVK